MILAWLNLICFAFDPSVNWLNGVLAIVLSLVAIVEAAVEFIHWHRD
jgi:hypothetical protein